MGKSTEKACSFTGHRPERLTLPQGKVKAWLKEQIEKAVDDGYTVFISGMQRGVDLWAAEAVLALREAGHDVKLIAACAFKGMENERGWSDLWKTKYKNVLESADEVQYIGRSPGRESYLKRNDWMVEQSSRLIAVFNGAPGGTKKTIDYARRLGLEVIVKER